MAGGDTPISRIRGDEVIDLIKMIRSCGLDLNLPLYELQLPGEGVPGSLARRGRRDGKHEVQEDSIVAHILRCGMIPMPANWSQNDAKSAVCVDFGAGKGRLSETLLYACGGRCDVLMIDRKVFKENQTRDKPIRRLLAECAPTAIVDRATVDIQHMDLAGLVGSRGVALAVSKHLCGPAFDMSMRKIQELNDSRAAEEGSPSPRVPIAMATCCHYLCSLESYTNPGFFLHELGWTENQFRVLCVVSQWASMDSGREARGNVDDADGSSNNFVLGTDADVTLDSEVFEKEFTGRQKVALGHQCKTLLDIGRVNKVRYCGCGQWPLCLKLLGTDSRPAQLRALGYKAELVRYTNASTEHRLILAWDGPGPVAAS